MRYCALVVGTLLALVGANPGEVFSFDFNGDCTLELSYWTFPLELQGPYNVKSVAAWKKIVETNSILAREEFFIKAAQNLTASKKIAFEAFYQLIPRCRVFFLALLHYEPPEKALKLARKLTTYQEQAHCLMHPSLFDV